MFKIKRLLIIFPFNKDVLDFQVEKVLSIVMQIKYLFVKKPSIFITVNLVSVYCAGDFL